MFGGGASTEKGQFFSSTPYLIDFITFSTPLPYKDPSFLHQKYVVEGLSASQIAAETFSSKPTILNYLKKFNIKTRRVGVVTHKKNIAYGKKIVGGKPADHKAEKKVIESIKEMYREGLSYRAIARVLNEMKIPTKQQGKGWHHENIRSILKSEGINSSKRKKDLVKKKLD